MWDIILEKRNREIIGELLGEREWNCCLGFKEEEGIVFSFGKVEE